MIEISVIELHGERVIFIPSHWQYKELIKSVPGTRYLSARGGWSAPLAWATVVTLRGVLGDLLDLHQSVIDWAWEERRRRVDPMMSIRELTTPPPVVEGDTVYELDERLHPFQRVGVRFLIEGVEATRRGKQKVQRPLLHRQTPEQRPRADGGVLHLAAVDHIPHGELGDLPADGGYIYGL